MVKREPEQTRYLTLTSLSDALEVLKKSFSFSPRIRIVPVQDSCGKITAEAIFSPLSFPSVHISAMDGIAVRSRDTIKATEQKPVIITNFAKVNTGNIVPPDYDAVIMIEDVEEYEKGYIIRASAHPWQNIRPVGEDIASSEMILPRMSQIKAADIGAMASYGRFKVPVLDLKVALIPTGNEIVPVGIMPRPGQVVESNMHIAAALISSVGASVTHYPIVPDDKEKISQVVSHAVENNDIVLISAGSSKGTKDFTAQIIAELGTVFVHGLAIKPAKPVILGSINGKPIIGMPGYPIACYTILREIVLPILGWYGFAIPHSDTIPVHLTNSIQSSIGTDEFILTTVGKIHNKWIAVPLSRGAGVQMAMVRSNAYIKIPANQEGLEAGAVTTAILTVQKKLAEQVVLITGSHDLSIDYLADMIRDKGIHLASSHIGSMGGLLALKKGFCHLAPMHMLDDDGDYNIPYLKKYFPDEELVLICVGERVQGIASRDVLGFDDITSHRFINRQRGSGTRMLLDHLLKQKGIRSDSIVGYDKEATTHLGVCLAIQSGDADLGMTINSAARAFSLPFIPIGVERYELVTTKKMFKEDNRIKKIVELIGSKNFKEVLLHLGGYETENTGVIRWCNKK